MFSKEENEVKQWILTVLQEKNESADLYSLLKDGTVLCRLINKITGIKSIYPRISKANFVQMENINYFIENARKLNVPDSENFSTPDLFENKNMKQVVICLYSLSRNLHKNGRTDLPVIGPTLVERPSIFNFTEEQINEAKRAVSFEYGCTPVGNEERVGK